jgi:type 1 fimbria pilin
MRAAARLLASLFLIAALASALPVLADSTGTMSGDVVAVSDQSIDINANRQTVRFALGSDFKGVYSAGVYSADRKTKRRLSDIKPGMFVRVAFIKTFVGSAYRKATEIDIITGYQLPLPRPSA